ncbi:UNVERIFIED_CONTAM: hypothetical protein H355_008313 [Colinus virginianus]|nr:hypothetical protein H355_008313 [Colinus virginianus]
MEETVLISIGLGAQDKEEGVGEQEEWSKRREDDPRACCTGSSRPGYRKRDHVDVYPVVLYEHPSFALAAAAAAGAARVKKQQGDASNSTADWLADVGSAVAPGADGGREEEDEDDNSSRKRRGARERREQAAFSAAAGSSCALPGGYHVEMNPLRVVASPVDVERRFATWIGGSILSCLGSFPQFAVTKEEYEEYGTRVAIGRKCP